MNKKILYQGQDIAVYSDLESVKNDILIITFTPRQSFKRDITADLSKHAFGASFLSKNKLPSIHFIASWNHWWQTKEMEEAIASVVNFLTENSFKKVWLYSSSMGATGALLSAGKLQPDGVLIISPQFTIDPKVITFDDRWKTDQKNIEVVFNEYTQLDKHIESYVMYDDGFKLDRIHAEMAVNFLSAKSILVRNSMHAPAQVLLDCGMLTKTILSIFYETFNLDEFNQEFESVKYQSPIYLLETCKLEISNNQLDEAERVLTICEGLLQSSIKTSQPEFVISQAIKLRDTINSLLSIDTTINKIGDIINKPQDIIKNNSKIIFDGEDLCVLFNKVDSSKATVITFSPRIGNVDQEVDLNSGFGNVFLTKNGMSSICFIAKKNHWWQTAEFDDALKVVKHILSLTNDRVWTYGASMGGTGALMAASPLNAYGTIAITPQWSVDMEITPFEPRWQPDRKNFKKYNNNWERPTSNTKVFLIYDRFFELDAQHIKRLSTEMLAEEINIPFSEHAPPGLLRELGLLSRLIVSILNGKFNPLEFRKLLRSKRSQSIMALTGASALLLKKNKKRWALQLSYVAIQNAKDAVNAAHTKRVDYSIITRTVSNHLTCLSTCDEFNVVIDVIKYWFPILNRMFDFTRFKLQAGLYKRDSAMVYEALSILWSREGAEPTAGMIGSTISAIKSTLREDQIKILHEKCGKTILASSYAEQYRCALLAYCKLKFSDETRSVGLGRNGYLFLTGGYHSVLDYITQRRQPEAQSFNHFSDNIKARSELCTKKQIQYLHVIFPDKQSVLKSEFPVEEYVNLGEEYLSKNQNLSDYLFYPKEVLTHSTPSFLKLDTHLSDLGYIEFTSALLEKLGVPNQEKIKELKLKCKKEVKYSGDLGTKLVPPLFDIRHDLVPDWDYQYLNNSVSLSNDGVVDIYLNPHASLNQRVFIFGDSFFRRSSLILSYFFKEVIFFRTRYFHKDLVDMGKPDIVLTGQAERYLSVVDSDEKAPVFMLYPYLKGVDINPSKEYATVMNAILSYGKPAYENLFNNK